MPLPPGYPAYAAPSAQPRPRFADQVLGMRAVVAVALACLIIGGLSGFILGHAAGATTGASAARPVGSSSSAPSRTARDGFPNGSNGIPRPAVRPRAEQSWLRARSSCAASARGVVQPQRHQRAVPYGVPRGLLVSARGRRGPGRPSATRGSRSRRRRAARGSSSAQLPWPSQRVQSTCRRVVTTASSAEPAAGTSPRGGRRRGRGRRPASRRRSGRCRRGGRRRRGP